MQGTDGCEAPEAPHGSRVISSTANIHCAPLFPCRVWIIGAFRLAIAQLPSQRRAGVSGVRCPPVFSPALLPGRSNALHLARRLLWDDFAAPAWPAKPFSCPNLTVCTMPDTPQEGDAVLLDCDASPGGVGLLRDWLRFLMGGCADAVLC